MFLRLKRHRTKSGREHVYAYIVKTKHTKNGPRQQVLKYLGKVNAYERISASTDTVTGEDFFQLVNAHIQRELEAHGFKKEGSLCMRKEWVINVEKESVKEGGREAGIALNNGVLCKQTIKNLHKISGKRKKSHELGKILGKAVLEAGLQVTKEEFLRLYDVLTKQTSNNDQQSSTMINNAKQ